VRWRNLRADLRSVGQAQFPGYTRLALLPFPDSVGWFWRVPAIDGPHAAQGIAKKIVQEIEKARAVEAAQAGRR